MLFSPLYSRSETAHFFLGLLDRKGCVPLPKSANPSRIDANLNGFIDTIEKLDDSDVERLDGVAASGKQKRFVMPPFGQFFVLLQFRLFPVVY